MSRSPWRFVGVLSLSASAALAQDPPQPRKDSVVTLQEIEVVGGVTGRGRVRAAATIDTGLTARVMPGGTSALRIIERLPGVNVQSVDAFGVYEWSTRVTMRGFATQQIGQTFDGVPLGDMSYGNWNGLNIARAVDPENLATTTVEQGSGALGTASGNNLGGVIQYRSADPANRGGLRFRQLVGDFNSLRTFLRLDLGLKQLSETSALRGFVSYSRTENDKWKGGGQRYSEFPGQKDLFFGQSGLFGESENWQDQFNLKLNWLLGGTKLTAFYNYSDKKESDYMDLSKTVFTAPQFGPGTDYLSDWELAKDYAEANNALTDVAYFFSAQGAREDNLAYLQGDFPIGSKARLVVMPYVHTNRGGGDWHAPSYGSSAFPDPIMFRQTQYQIDRVGATGRLAAEFGQHRLEGGVWFEANEVNLRRPRWRLLNYQQGPEVDFSNVLRLDFDRTGELTSTLFFLQNTTRLVDDRLRLTYGLKYLHVEAEFRSNGNTPTNGVIAPSAPDANRPSLSLPTSGLLPQMGLVYGLTPSEELFFNWSENVNQYPYSPQSGVYNADPALFAFLEDATDPERASTFDLGIRTTRNRVQAGLTAYYIDYRNRLIGIALCPPTVTCTTGLGNVGSVRTFGAEALVDWDMGRGFRWFTSGALNDSKFQDDYLARQDDPSTVVNTKDKRVQDAPTVLLTTSLGFERGGFNANTSLRYVGKRYFTYTNDLSPGDGEGFVDSYSLVDLGAGYRFPPLGALQGLSVQVNVRNLFDETHVATLGSNGFTASGDNQTLLTGARRLFYVTFGFDL